LLTLLLFSYWTKDIASANPHFGTDQDLKDLSDALHKRGMFLMLDVVVNHVAAPALPGHSNFSLKDFYHPFTDETYFHKQCLIDSSVDQTIVEQCWLGDESLPLPDLNTEDDRVVQILNDWVKNIVQEYAVDGLRIDTVKHIRKDFWPTWAQSSGVFTMGEVLANDTDYAAPYTGL
jgi:alpha-amylase